MRQGLILNPVLQIWSRTIPSATAPTHLLKRNCKTDQGSRAFREMRLPLTPKVRVMMLGQ